MARGTQLITLVDELRHELGRSTDLGVGVDDVPALKTVLRRVQESLYDEYPWPHLHKVFDPIPLQAGQRYYDVPETINFDRIDEVVVWRDGLPLPITRGIGFAEYAAYRSDADERSDPALRWEIRADDLGGSPKEVVEVWPMPASNDQELQFTGVRALSSFVNDHDRCDIDDKIIVLFAAAELLARQKSEDASAKLAQAQQRLARLQGNSQTGRPMARLGMGRPRHLLQGRTVVRVGR